MKNFGITILFIILHLLLLGQMNPPIIMGDNFKDQNASDYTSSYGDISCDLQIDDVLEEWNNGEFTNSKIRSNIGFTKVCFWRQFQISNETDFAKPVLIEISNPELEGIEFIILNEQNEIVKSKMTGAKYPFNEREIKYRNFLFRLNAEPDIIYNVFVKVNKQPNYVNIPIKVWEMDHKLYSIQRSEYRLGVFYGLMILYLFLIALMSYFLQDKYYLYYTLMLGIGTFFIFINEGLAFQYLWPGSPRVQMMVRYFVLNCYMLVSILFVENFVRNKLESLWSVYILRGCIIFLTFLTLFILLYPTMGLLMQFRISILLSIVLIILHLILLGILFLSYKKTKDKAVFAFFFAISIAFCIVIFFTLIKFGLLPVNIDSTWAIYSGGAIVGVIFTSLFAFRVKNVIQDNKEMRTELGLAGIKSSFALLEGMEKERKRVADELHDGVGIKMSALKMKLSTEKSSKDGVAISQIIDQVDNSCANIRSLSHSLVPRNLERYGLIVAIKDLISEINAEYSINIRFRQKRLAENIDEMSKLAIYRLVEGVLYELARRKVEHAILKLVIIPSIQQASINFKYIGRRVEFGVNINLETVRTIIQVLNGQVRWMMDTMWSNQLDIEIPVVSEMID